MYLCDERGRYAGADDAQADDRDDVGEVFHEKMYATR